MQNNPDIKRHCMDCDQQFTITTSEQDFYNSKNMPLPKRCAPCRKDRRERINPIGGRREARQW